MTDEMLPDSSNKKRQCRTALASCVLKRPGVRTEFNRLVELPPRRQLRIARLRTEGDRLSYGETFELLEATKQPCFVCLRENNR